MNSKSCVVSFLKCDGRSIIASVRIAKFIAEELDLPLIDRDPSKDWSEVNPERLPDPDHNFETLIIVNGPSAFLPWVDELARMVQRAKRVIWVMNDYTIYPPTQVRKVFNERHDLEVQLWGTLPDLPSKWKSLAVWTRFPSTADAYVNWNMLTYELLPFVEPTVDGLYYYGAFRDGRKLEFSKYFATNKYRVKISTSNRAEEKFEDIFDYTDTKFEFHPKWKSFSDFQKFKMTLYIHDKFSTQHFCSPANRFYECLSAGVAMVFDESCVDTFLKDTFHIDVRPYVVKNATEIQEKLLFWKRIREEQRAKWSHDYLADLKAVVKKVGIDFEI